MQLLQKYLNVQINKILFLFKKHNEVQSFFMEGGG